MVRDGVSAAVLLIAIFVMGRQFTSDVLATAWDNEGILHTSYVIMADLLGASVYVELIVVGLALGLTVVWTFDTYKKYQTFAPLTLLAVVTYGSGVHRGWLDGELTVVALAFLLVSGVAGAQIGGLPVLQRTFGSVQTLVGRPPVSLSRAPQLFFVAVLAVVAVGLIDVHVALDGGAGTFALEDRDDLPAHSVVGLVLVAAFYMFTRYDNDVRIVQLGPARSGKTSMLGGLAADIDRDAREGDGSGAIDDVRYSLEKRRRFPDITEDVDYYDFSYMSRHPIFRKRNTISTIDYPGEKLVGGGNEAPLSDQIANLREQEGPRLLARTIRRVRRVFPLVSATNPREAAIAELDEEGTDDMKALARLVDTANCVVFTVPLDDFLTRALKRENVPDYLKEVRLIEPTDVPDKYIVRTLDNEPVRIKRSDGKLVNVEDGEPYTEAEWESFEDLPETVSGERYYLDRDRSTKDEYRKEFREVIRILNEDREKSFVWVTTMTDLVNEDFNEVYKRAQHLVDEDDIEDRELEMHVERVRNAELFDPNPKQFKKHDYHGRAVHARWIQRECIETAWPDFDDILADTFETLIYPVWFNIYPSQPEEELRIKIDGQKTLQGSDLVLDRFEGRELLEKWSPLVREDTLTESGYRVLYAASRRLDDPESDRQEDE